jgi:hypothetical protein
MPDKISVVEGVEEHWNYHLRKAGDLRSLCGKTVMTTGVPLAAWGVVTHLNESYCPTCKALAETLPQEKTAAPRNKWLKWFTPPKYCRQLKLMSLWRAFTQHQSVLKA